jgi:hypothetical protein
VKPVDVLPRLVFAGMLAGTAPLAAQTVIPRDTAPPPRVDSGRARPDSAAKPAKVDSAAKPAVAPAPVPAPNPYPKGVCSDESAGGQAPDVLLVTFKSRSGQPEREAAIKTVKGTLIAPDPSDDRSWFVRVPGEGNEFVLRGIADRLIRVAVVNEVGPVQCPARP